MIDIKEEIKKPEYDFLRTEPHLGHNIILLGLGGSHAYGTNTPTSDVDIRGIALNNKRDILLNTRFDQVVDNPTDTTIYSLDKIISLLSNCNPNTIELLGLREDQYIASKLGKALIANKDMFLSKRAYYSFGGYATAQLRRLENKSVRQANLSRREEHILNSIVNGYYSFKTKYEEIDDDALKLYMDKTVREGYDKEIYLDCDLKHYPLIDFEQLFNEIFEIRKSYDKVGKRNQRAIEHDKLGKHQMHLCRLYLMAFDILEKHEINTYREHDIPFLMDVRNNKYLDENNQVVPEFYDILNEYEKRLSYDKENTDLPENPNYQRINDFLYDVNNDIVDYEYLDTEDLV